GKSSLVHGSLAGRDGVLVVDQSAIRGSRRSNPATYTGLLDPIRTAFAKANGVKASLFSANSEGACPTCTGQGVVYTDLGMMAGVATRCEACGGRRFRPDVLEHRLHGLTIDEVLRLSMAEAAEVFATGTPHRILTRLLDVGLPYLTLGQPLTTLSGGERQRLRLAASLGDAETYVLDEPTSGLHLADTENLVGMLHGLVDRGTTVVVIEHSLAVIAQADWIIDIGPGAGHDGGTVVFVGTPQDMVAGSDTLTAQHLRRWVSPPD
ncbi:MAG TPA: excinuclease ABC subunit UvrA, partial [Ornithinibacter sp.]|nr:excinuclease ABC subunit UvrA [Ornithinibacter sp.]